jgi:hypothetical protein
MEYLSQTQHEPSARAKIWLTLYDIWVYEKINLGPYVKLALLQNNMNEIGNVQQFLRKSLVSYKRKPSESLGADTGSQMNGST